MINSLKRRGADMGPFVGQGFCFVVASRFDSLGAFFLCTAEMTDRKAETKQRNVRGNGKGGNAAICGGGIDWEGEADFVCRVR
jgi:hypothetical protein